MNEGQSLGRTTVGLFDEPINLIKGFILLPFVHEHNRTMKAYAVE